MSALRCPTCWQLVVHTRGWLHEHNVTVMRGEIVTGTRMCDGSNTKPPVPLKTIKLTGTCLTCFTPYYDEAKETFPGSLVGYPLISYVDCEQCTTAVLVTDNHVIAEPGDAVS